ncbi:hypothetical protein WJ978_20180 [Achromobacter xylosoxidans]
MTLQALGQAYPQTACEAVLHPSDVIATTVQLPAVAKARLNAAVLGALEPLVLSDLDDLAIGHGPRGADGNVALAWAPREPVRRAWSLLRGGCAPTPWSRPRRWRRTRPRHCATPRTRAGWRRRHPGRWPCRNWRLRAYRAGALPGAGARSPRRCGSAD